MSPYKRTLTEANVSRQDANRWQAEARAWWIRSEREGGRRLLAMEKNVGAMGSGSNQHKLRSHDATAPTLEDLGITKTESSRWQMMARVPDDVADVYHSFSPVLWPTWAPREPRPFVQMAYTNCRKSPMHR